MRDISNTEDIILLVDTFYDLVKKDDLLAPFFLNLNFDEHKPKMVLFWEFVLLDKAGYTTNVTDKHMKMRLAKEHFDRWITLFNQTIDELFSGEKCELAKQRAFLIGWTIQNKMQS
jgi:hemoglobin